MKLGERRNDGSGIEVCRLGTGRLVVPAEAAEVEGELMVGPRLGGCSEGMELGSSCMGWSESAEGDMVDVVVVIIVDG